MPETAVAPSAITEILIPEELTTKGSLPMYFPPGFSLEDALACAKTIDIAYDQYQQWENAGFPRKGDFLWKPKHRELFTDIVPLFWPNRFLGRDFDEPFGFLAQMGNGNAFLSFRGTMSCADQFQNARTGLARYSLAQDFGSVHTGFLEIYVTMSKTIHEVMKGFRDIKRFFFTGHSLGGALSSLAVPDVVLNTNLKSAGALQYNLGTPRVGDPKYAFKMNTVTAVPTFRIINTEDIVVGVPLIGIGTCYQHLGTPVDFTAQYCDLTKNHSFVKAYLYALTHPKSPQGSVTQHASYAALAIPEMSPLAITAL